jgi:molybdopterin biosynthesis enzyme
LRNDRRETLVLDDALGRVTAAPAFARLSSPHYHARAPRVRFALTATPSIAQA